MDADGAIRYIHTDHLGTPRAVTESGGTTVWRWISSPFGDTKPANDPDGDGETFTLNLRFAGQYFDAETGRHYNYFRTYDPSIGRYASSDPIGLRGGLNTFTYARATPVSVIDPRGQAAVTVPVITITIGVKELVIAGGVVCILTDCGEELGAVLSETVDDDGDDSCPPVPDDYVGTDDGNVSEQKNRRNKGPLAPENGGTGDPAKDFDKLTGGTGRPDPENDGQYVGDNNIRYRPNAKGGPRIDIPAKGDKKHETLHY